MAGIWLMAAPVVLPLLGLADVARKSRFAGLRLGLFGGVYLAAETAGILTAFVLWLSRALPGQGGERYLARNFQLERWWAGTLVGAVRRIFGVEFEIETRGDLSRGPVLVMMRHASLADTLIGSLLFSIPHGLKLRYVLKSELLVDPCLDIVGHRLPNVFVRRDGADSARQIQGVAALARDLGPEDGVLIYPEGTRFTEPKRRRILARLRERGQTETLEVAETLRHTLPPKAGGPLALFEAAPDADVVLCMHTGFEAAATLAEIWSGSLVGRRIRIRCVRIPAHTIPADASTWLLERWQEVDEFVGKHHEAR